MRSKLLQSFLADSSGATAVEYGLLVSMIALGLMVGLAAFSDGLKETLELIASEVEKTR